jgi:hypothetical protein
MVPFLAFRRVGITDRELGVTTQLPVLLRRNMPARDAESVGLPVRDFLYTVDQIATLLEVGETQVYDNYLHYDGRSVGPRPKGKMIARDVSSDDDPKPEWRVTEREFIRWMKFKGYRYHTRGYLR